MENTEAGGACRPGEPRVSVGMVSLGCPKNQVDGEAMLGMLQSGGYIITPDADAAAVIIVNTCGFIDAAKKESINAILEMADKKAGGRCRALIVTGCLAERYRGEFEKELPEVDAVLGAGEYGLICETVDKLINRAGNPQPSKIDSGRSVADICETRRFAHLNAERVLTGGAGCVYIKIAEGCGNRCSYCVIPSIRGPYASRPLEDVIAEAGRLAHAAAATWRAGCSTQSEHSTQAERFTQSKRSTRGAPAFPGIEANLVAQDTTKYLADKTGAAGSEGLCGLIGGLSALDGVKWIRVLYAYPDRVDDRLINMLAQNGKLLKYLDVPVQHASDVVLAAMGRRYDGEYLYKLIERLRREAPGIVLRTTVMTGFPGESEADFERLLDFVEFARFERLGVFAYSREEGTAAAKMDGQIPKKIARARRAHIIKLQSKIMSGYEAGRVGREYEVIIESGPAPARDGRLAYRARTYAEAPQTDGSILAYANTDAPGRDFAKPGCFRRLLVTNHTVNGLTGEIIN